MPRIILENKRKYKGTGIYVGRPTPLGNPFLLTADTPTTRRQCIRQYHQWLRRMMYVAMETSDDPKSMDHLLPAERKTVSQARAAMKMLDSLVEMAGRGDVTLICWCTPLQCHASIIKSAIRYLQRMRGMEVSH